MLLVGYSTQTIKLKIAVESDLQTDIMKDTGKKTWVLQIKPHFEVQTD